MKGLAWKIVAERIRDEDIIAILLFGSLTSENIHLKSDLDLVVIRDVYENLMVRDRSVREGITIDLWEHSCMFYASLFEKDWQPKEMFWYSLFLNILQGCEVLHDTDSTFRNYRENAMQWRWPESCKDFIEDKIGKALVNYSEDYDKFEKLVYLRKVFLLDTCRRLLDIGKPVSLRNKDYYLKCKRHFSAKDFESIFGKTPNVEELRLLVETAMDFFYREVKNREPWTELKDAKNHLSSGNRFMTTISLQNGAYYIGSVGLSKREIKRENKGFLYPESEIEVIKKSKEHWGEFHLFYRKVHNVDAWRNQEIDDMFSQLVLV